MVSSKNQRLAECSIPRAPFLYINDPTDDAIIVSKLGQMIPKILHVSLADCPDHSAGYLSTLKNSKHQDTVLIFASKLSDNNNASKKALASLIRDTAIRVGCNFASIDVHADESAVPSSRNANHLNIAIQGCEKSLTDSEAKKTAETIYQWLFTVLTVKETLHLISDEQMRELDPSTSFSDYEYCAIGEHSKVGKGAKVQFVALIVTKPSILSEKKLIWQIADKTGVANIYFKWHGPSSQYTWDWILNLQPGQRKCLPRSPRTLVQEKLSIAIIKAPIRIPGQIIEGAGDIVKKLGVGLTKAGKKMQMGKCKTWVTQEDISEFLKKHPNVRIVPNQNKITVQVFSEKGEKMWKDNDSCRSTLKDEAINEKAPQLEKEFV